MTSRRFKVAIIGGGIGGLTSVVALSKCSDVEVDLYEAAAQFSELGAGLGLWPRAWKVLNNLGIGGDLASLTSDPLDDEYRLAYVYRRSDNLEGKLEGTDLCELSTLGGLPTFHRGQLQQTILKHLPASCRCHLSKRLISYTDAHAGPISLEFQDGTTATCDLLIGADGVKSAVRGCLLKSLTPLDDSGIADITAEELSDSHVWYSGSVAYRGLAPPELVRELAPNHRAFNGLTMYCGKRKHLLAYPISQGRSINVVGFASDPSTEGKPYPGPWAVEISNEDLLDVYSDFEEEVKILLKCTEKPKQYAVHALKPLSSYTAGRVVLIGDAAHAMTPHQGSGAGQAIEDAHILAALLSDAACTAETLPIALNIYSRIRQPLATRVVEGSRLTGMLFDLCHPGVDNLADGQDVKPHFIEALNGITEQWQRAWTTSAEDDRDMALDMFKRELLEAGRPGPEDIDTAVEGLTHVSRL